MTPNERTEFSEAIRAQDWPRIEAILSRLEVTGTALELLRLIAAHPELTNVAVTGPTRVTFTLESGQPIGFDLQFDDGDEPEVE